MNEEIKEILDRLEIVARKHTIEVCDDGNIETMPASVVDELRLNNYSAKLLLDYITNLQEELEHYKQLGLNQKQFEYKNKIKVLEHNCKQAEESCRQHRLANKNKKRRLERKNKQLQNYKTRIDTAIEYLKEDLRENEYENRIDHHYIINILQGKSDE